MEPEKIFLAIFIVIVLGLGFIVMTIKALWPRKLEFSAYELSMFRPKLKDKLDSTEYELPGATMILLSSTDYSRVNISWESDTGKLTIGSKEPVKFEFMVAQNGRWEVLEY